MRIENLKLSRRSGIPQLAGKIGLLIGLFVYLSISSIPAKAGALSLSIDPSIIEINALPPSNVSSSLTIQNKSDSQVTLRTEIREFRAKLENGELEYLENNSSIVNNTYILDNGIPVESITLGPSQEKNLTLNIIIPENSKISRPTSPTTSPTVPVVGRRGKLTGGRADYYFSIIFVSDNTSSPTSSASLNQLGIVSNVLLSVGAKETPDAVVEEFSVGLFYESGPVPFTVRIKNKGTHFIKPKGEVIIKNMFGQSIGKLDLVSVNILSRSIRAIPDGTYMQELRSQDNSKALVKSDLDFQHPKALWKEDFLLGFYTATLNIVLSGEGPSFTKSIHFFAFPFQGLIVIVIVLISTIIIVNRVRTHMKK